jgi:PKD repeat protein
MKFDSICGTGTKRMRMKRIPGYSLIIWCAVILVGCGAVPVTAVSCDGPPQSQSLILFSGGCDRSAPVLPCTQGFIFPAQPSALGDYPTQYFLDFGDGSPPYYGLVDGVTHTYNVPGRFTLKFMAGTQCDLWRSDTFVMNISTPFNYTPVIPVCEPEQPSAGFTGNPTYGVAPLIIQFTSTSSGATMFTWNFGDGGTSPLQNPRHTYRTAGIYPVSLEARDTCSGTISRVGLSSFITVSPPATTLTVTSTPPGAVLFIDNITKGITPLTVTDTASGYHRILLTMAGYEDYTRNTYLEAATPSTIAAVLNKRIPEPTIPPPLNGSIAITSIPSGAVVNIDGIQRGSAPVIIPGVFPGNHAVTLSFNGYDDWSYMVSVRSGQMSEMNAILVPKNTTSGSGSLSVTTDPPGAEVYIDSDFKGVSPLTIPGLIGGTHTIMITMQEYVNNSTILSIPPGKTLKFTTVLQKQFKLSAIDLILAAGAIGMIVIIALVVMLKKETKKK